MNDTAHKIRRGVSFYSFQEEYFLGKMDLESCIQASIAIGALGIETVADQMMPGFPELSDAFYDTWHGWVAEYGFVPTAHNHFAELKLYKGRPRPVEELVDDLLKDIDHTVRLGAAIVRVLAATPPEVIAHAAPYAAERGVLLLTEIHAPHRFNDEWFQRHMEVAERFGPDVVGIMPDLGIFVRRLPRVMSERAVRDGADPAFVQRVVERFDNGEDVYPLFEEAERKGVDPVGRRLAFAATRITWQEPTVMLDYMPYIRHIQAKFYDMVDDRNEYSIPYEEIIPVLIRGGYEGYLSSEYEGNRHIQDAFPVDSIEQLRRQHVMMAALLGEKETIDV